MRNSWWKSHFRDSNQVVVLKKSFFNVTRVNFSFSTKWKGNSMRIFCFIYHSWIIALGLWLTMKWNRNVRWVSHHSHTPLIFPQLNHHFSAIKIWLQKLCGENYQSVQQKRCRNIYLANLLVCMQNKELDPVFLKCPKDVNVIDALEVFTSPSELEVSYFSRINFMFALFFYFF